MAEKIKKSYLAGIKEKGQEYLDSLKKLLDKEFHSIESFRELPLKDKEDFVVNFKINGLQDLEKYTKLLKEIPIEKKIDLFTSLNINDKKDIEKFKALLEDLYSKGYSNRNVSFEDVAPYFKEIQRLFEQVRTIYPDIKTEKYEKNLQAIISDRKKGDAYSQHYAPFDALKLGRKAILDKISQAEENTVELEDYSNSKIDIKTNKEKLNDFVEDKILEFIEDKFKDKVKSKIKGRRNKLLFDTADVLKELLDEDEENSEKAKNILNEAKDKALDLDEVKKISEKYPIVEDLINLNKYISVGQDAINFLKYARGAYGQEAHFESPIDNKVFDTFAEFQKHNERVLDNTKILLKGMSDIEQDAKDDLVRLLEEQIAIRTQFYIKENELKEKYNIDQDFSLFSSIIDGNAFKNAWYENVKYLEEKNGLEEKYNRHLQRNILFLEKYKTLYDDHVLNQDPYDIDLKNLGKKNTQKSTSKKGEVSKKEASQTDQSLGQFFQIGKDGKITVKKSASASQSNDRSKGGFQFTPDPNFDVTSIGTRSANVTNNLRSVNENSLDGAVQNSERLDKNLQKVSQIQEKIIDNNRVISSTLSSSTDSGMLNESTSTMRSAFAGSNGDGVQQSLTDEMVSAMEERKEAYVDETKTLEVETGKRVEVLAELGEVVKKESKGGLQIFVDLVKAYKDSRGTIKGILDTTSDNWEDLSKLFSRKRKEQSTVGQSEENEVAHLNETLILEQEEVKRKNIFGRIAQYVKGNGKVIVDTAKDIAAAYKVSEGGIKGIIDVASKKLPDVINLFKRKGKDSASPVTGDSVDSAISSSGSEEGGVGLVESTVGQSKVNVEAYLNETLILEQEEVKRKNIFGRIAQYVKGNGKVIIDTAKDIAAAYKVSEGGIKGIIDVASKKLPDVINLFKRKGKDSASPVTGDSVDSGSGSTSGLSTDGDGMLQTVIEQAEIRSEVYRVETEVLLDESEKRKGILSQIGEAFKDNSKTTVETILSTVDAYKCSQGGIAGIIDVAAQKLPELLDLFKLNNKEINENVKQSNEERVDSIKDSLDNTEMGVKTSFERIEEYTSQVMEGINTVFDWVKESMQSRLEEADEQYNVISEKYDEVTEKVKESNDRIRSLHEEAKDAQGGRLIIIQEQISREMESNKALADQEQELAKEKEKAEAERAKMEKKIKKTEIQQQLIQGIASTALGVTKALGSSPPPINFVMAALVGAAGAIQIASISKQLSKLADGGLLRGNLHAQGGMRIEGTNIEVEGGEYVVNRHSTNQNMGLIRYINSQRRHLTSDDISGFFSAAGSSSESSNFKSMFAEGGQLPSDATMSMLDSDPLVRAIESIDMQPVVSVVDIANVQQSVVKVSEWTNTGSF